MRIEVTPRNSQVLETHERIELHVVGENSTSIVTVCPGHYQITEEKKDSYGEKFWRINCIRIGRGKYAKLSAV